MATNVPIEGALLPRSIKLSIDLLSCVLVASSSNVNPCVSRKDRTFEPIIVSTFFVSTAADPFLLVAISLCPHHHRLSKPTGRNILKSQFIIQPAVFPVHSLFRALRRAYFIRR